MCEKFWTLPIKRQPSDYVARKAQGSRFISKRRGAFMAIEPSHSRPGLRCVTALWAIREIEDVNLARVKALLEDGLSLREIAEETGIPKSTVHRLKKMIEAEAAAEPEEAVNQRYR
jgi:putative DNA primase/helicase